MAGSVGKIMLKMILSFPPCLSDRRIMFPKKSRLLISIPVLSSSLTCLSLPTPTAKAIAQRPHRMLAPFIFPFTLSYDEPEGAVVQKEVRQCSVHFSSHFPRLCGSMKQHWKATETNYWENSISSLKLSLCKAPTISKNNQYMVNHPSKLDGISS